MRGRRTLTCAVLIWTCCVSASVANAPNTSLRPVARGEVHPAVILPIHPKIIGVRPTVQPKQGLTQSLRPKARPKGLGQKTVKPSTATKGVICGTRDIIGTPAGRVPGKSAGCGIGDAVRVSSVSGVALTRPALVDCATAKALKTWVDRGLKPNVGRYGGGVSELKIFASYACRTRNSKKGAKISEHAKGRAVDIGVISLKNGTEISVLRDWRSGKKGRILKTLHESACGPFGTVLGPDADKYHRDHFHFDTARYRNGNYCR